MGSVVIKTFATPGGNYVYDREIDSIFNVNTEDFPIFYRVESGEASDDDWQLLKRYRDQGYLQESRLKEIEHPATEYMPFYLDSGMSQLTMQVTQDCNLRCSYCTYGGGYGNQRTHSKKTMTLDMMKKCVDFIMARSYGVERIAIGFYGGEPLLELDKIKACVAYANEVYYGRSVLYTITTNGTFLNDDALRFLVANDFNLMVSIDGPRELHDINRTYADGRGSFDDIIKNVKHIKEHYPDYYGKISFMNVVAPGVDFSCVNEFYSVDDVLTDDKVRLTLVREFGATENIVYDDLYRLTSNFEIMKVFLSKIGLYSMDKTSKMFDVVISNIDRLYEGLSTTTMPEKAHPGGPCVPGAMRPFVDVDGKIFPCERVSEGSEAMQIGHIETGFDKDKIHAVLNVGLLTKQECLSCWCFSHCTSCVATCDGDDMRLCGEERLKHCDRIKNTSIETLMTICMMAENGRNFDNLER